MSTTHPVNENSWLYRHVEQPPVNAVRLSDGRILAWADYGSPGGVPVLLLADRACSRLAPAWLLHDSALPSGIRLLAVDRPGTGLSDPVTISGQNNLPRDLSCLICTLAVGRVAVVAIETGAADGIALTAAYPALVTGLTLVSPRTDRPDQKLRHRLRPLALRGSPPSLLHQLLAAADGRDLRDETTWPRLLNRLAPTAVAAIDKRWQETDFRSAVAADVAQTGPNPTGVRVPPALLQTTRVDGSVTIWRGAEEPPDPLITMAPSHPGWKVTTVPGPTATLGYWPDILGAAARSWTEQPGESADTARNATTNDLDPSP